MFRRQGRRTNPDGLSQSVELHEAASPYRHPRYHRPSAKEKLIPLVRSAATGGTETVQVAVAATDPFSDTPNCPLPDTRERQGGRSPIPGDRLSFRAIRRQRAGVQHTTTEDDLYDLLVGLDGLGGVCAH
jgi:hypothetical protein